MSSVNYALKKILVGTLRMMPSGHKLSENAGTMPGTLIYTGKMMDEVPEITLYQYDEAGANKFTDTNPKNVLQKIDPAKRNWINVSAIHQTDVLQQIGDCFHLHPLVMEDIPNTLLSPQYEDYDDYLFLTLKMLSINQETHLVEQEHVSFVLGSNYVLSFQERKKDVFDPVRQRLESAIGKIRKRGVDYLLYALIDVIVDNYYGITEEVSDQMAQMEDSLIREPKPNSVESITNYKRQLIDLRKSVYPLRDALGKLDNEEELINKNTMRFFQDVYSHIAHVINTMETQQEILSGFMDLYMSSLSHKMNDVMKTLTIISTVFIPLTFIAGIYGMNFHYMPELTYHWGYPIALLFMLVVGSGMYMYMKSQKWF